MIHCTPPPDSLLHHSLPCVSEAERGSCCYRDKLQWRVPICERHGGFFGYTLICDAPKFQVLIVTNKLFHFQVTMGKKKVLVSYGVDIDAVGR